MCLSFANAVCLTNITMFFSHTMIGTLSRCINSLQLYDDESSPESNEAALEDASLHLRKVKTCHPVIFDATFTDKMFCLKRPIVPEVNDFALRRFQDGLS